MVKTSHGYLNWTSTSVPCRCLQE